MSRVIVVGSGVAGITASIYLVRAGINTTLITGENVGGSLTYAPKVENFPGFPEGIKGHALMALMLTQAQIAGVSIVEDSVDAYTRLSDKGHSVHLADSDKTLYADGVIFALGLKHKKPSIDNLNKFEGNGVHYCALCDGSLYKGCTVGVIGGGNTAFQDALYLSSICKQVHIFVRKDKARADRCLVEQVNHTDNIFPWYGTEVVSLCGKSALESVVITRAIDTQDRNIDISALFIAVGHTANTECLSKTPNFYFDADGFVTGTPKGSIYVAGDCISGASQQGIIAAGSGAEVALKMIKDIRG